MSDYYSYFFGDGDSTPTVIYDASDNPYPYPYPDPDPQPDGVWLANGTNIYNANTGNVGIGTSNPQKNLDVIGTIKADRVIGVDYNDLLNKPTNSDQLWNLSEGTITGTNVGRYVAEHTIETTTLEATTVNCVETNLNLVNAYQSFSRFDNSDWNVTRGIMLHNNGRYVQPQGAGGGSGSGGTITGTFGDARNPENAESEPYGGRLFHAQPLTNVNNPPNAEVFTCMINGVQYKYREIIDENGFINWHDIKNRPFILVDDESKAFQALAAIGGVVGGLLVAGLGISQFSSGFGSILSDFFNIGNSGGGGGGGGSGDPQYGLKAYWKNIKQVPFAAKSSGLVAIDGDLLVSSSRRLRSIIPGTFSTDLDTGSRVVSDTEASQETFIDFEYQRYYGKRFLAKEGNNNCIHTAFGIGFGANEVAALDNYVLTSNYLKFGNWAFSKDGIYHIDSSGNKIRVLWWDKEGYKSDNYHIFAANDKVQPRETQGEIENQPAPPTLREKVAQFVEDKFSSDKATNKVVPRNTTPELTPAQTPSAPKQRSVSMWGKVKDVASKVNEKLNTYTEKAGELVEKKAIQGATKGAHKTQKVVKKIANFDADKAVKAGGKWLSRTIDNVGGGLKNVATTLLK